MAEVATRWLPAAGDTQKSTVPLRKEPIDVTHGIRKLAVIATAGITAAGAFAAAVIAAPPDGPNLTAVPTANPKSDGLSPASRLSP
jgi:CRISPR-associated DxTHG motif protein